MTDSSSLDGYFGGLRWSIGYSELARALDAAIATSDFLSAAVGAKVWVSPVIALIATDVYFESRSRHVEMLFEHQLIPWLSARPSRLARCVVDRIAAAASRPATWAQ